ncbi:MAG: magnesium chelatase subunit D [Puniceicoccaceae bacterium 5H]|nr:MAG: magnesium chelatase subunit D [Puniceicoccaceae bacterium 5H]
MKLALLLHAVCPQIGGVLIRGQKGTAKSTAVRALAELLPPVQGATASAMPAPFVDLPLGATEDRVIGSLDLEAALQTGRPTLQKGLLARAHRGILYVDEINLLDDYLIDGVLDVAASGINLIEREGLSAWHEAAFVLVGTMNPEEGDLRPQLLDRFGLAVDVEAEQDLETRKLLLRRREAFDLHPAGLRAQFEPQTTALRQRIQAARERSEQVRLPAHLLDFIAEICNRHQVAGHRADLTIQTAARAHAAWQGRLEVEAADVMTVAPMALRHRMRTSEPAEMPPPPQEGAADEAPPEEPEPQNQTQPDDADDGTEAEEPPAGNVPPPPLDPSGDDVQPAGDPFPVRRWQQNDLRNLRKGSGRRNRTRSATRQGRYIKSTFRMRDNDLALDATLRAAAPFQRARRERNPNGLAVQVERSDQRGRVREKRVGSFLLFAVDASGSMGARKRMTETKSAILSLLLDAYQKRDRVALISFRGRNSELVLPPTNSVDLAARLLGTLPVGGRTPLASALVEIDTTLTRALRREPTLLPLVVLLTDGRANAGLADRYRPHEEALLLAGHLGQRFSQARFVVVDTEPPGLLRLGLAVKIAEALGAEYFQTADLKAEQLIAITRT